MTLMDAKAYAKHRKVSGPMVTKYLQAGLIPSAKRNGRTWIIDSTQADIELEKNLQKEFRKSIDSRNNQPTSTLKVDNGHQTPVPSLAANRAIRELYTARITKLEYEEKAGKLVQLDELKLKLAKVHLQVRDRLRTIPDRIAPLLTAETDQSKIHNLIVKELGQALEGLHDIKWS